MIATFHYKQDGRWNSIDCDRHDQVEFNTMLSRSGIACGGEEGFYIEWH